MAVQLDPKYLSKNKDEVERILASVATIDDAPTAESDNPVKSGGVATAIQEAVENLPMASEENVRGIVSHWTPPESEPEEDDE